MGSGRNSTKNLYFAQILPAISFPENFDILLEEMLANSGKAYSAEHWTGNFQEDSPSCVQGRS